MEKEELLKPRYKVIADYPCAILEVGQIINTYESAMTYVTESEKVCLKDYPHLFTPLKWWEERKADEMPGYVKDEDGTVYKTTWTDSPMKMHCEGYNGSWHVNNKVMCFYEPATEEEYQFCETQKQ